MDTNDIDAGGQQSPEPDNQQQPGGGNTSTSQTVQSTGTVNTADNGSNPFADVNERDKQSYKPQDQNEEKQHLYGMTEKLLIAPRYEWPENRLPMEEVIQSLRDKQVLFIKCPDRNHFHQATQRLTASLQTMGHLLGNLPAPVRSNKHDQPLRSYFWKTFRRQSIPVIIILYHHYLEYVKTLLARDDKEVFTDIIAPLREKNIYLVIPLPEEAEIMQITGEERASTLLKSTYAHWEMPVVKLTLNKRYQVAGPALLQAIQEDPDLIAVPSFDQHHLLRSIPDNAPETDLLALMKKANQAYVSRFDNGVTQLSALLASEDVLAQMVIFTAAFFPGINMTDFNYLVDFMLGDEQEIQAVPNEKKPPRLLKELWGSRAIVQQYLNKCMLRASDSDGKVVIDFTEHKLRDTIRKVIKKDYLFLYYSIFENLTSSGLLFKPDVQASLREAIIHFLVPAAQKIITCHEPDWLTELFFENLRNILEHVIKDEEVINVIKDKPEQLLDAILKRVLGVASNNKMFLNSITSDLILLFGDMSKAEGRVFHTTLNTFVRKLVDLYRMNETGLDIILPIYKKILNNNEIAANNNGQPATGDDDKLTREGLINHFSRALEDSTTVEQMFAAYNKMLDHFGRWTFLSISSDWIKDKETTTNKWTKKMAWLFQIDFCIHSFISYFDKEEKDTYELFNDPQEVFVPDLAPLVKNITSEACLKACDELLPYKETFDSRMYWLEYGVTRLKPLVTRIAPQYKKAYTLSADIIENWFSILAADKVRQPEENTTWSSFATIVIREAFPKTLSQIMQYWRVKTGIYTDTLLAIEPIFKDKAEREKKMQTLKTRRACLRKLLETFSVQSKK